MNSYRSIPDPDGTPSLVSQVDPVLADLASAVEGLRLPVSTEVLAGMLTLTDRMTALTSTLVDEVATAQLYEDDGAASIRGWLQDLGHLTKTRATAMSKTARRLRGCPVTHVAWMSGRLSGGQVDAIVANLSDRVAGLWAEHEAALVPLLSPLSTAETVAAMREWRAKADAVLDGDGDKAERPNELYHSHTLDGRSVLSGNFDSLSGALLNRALADAMEAFNREDEEPVPLSQRRAAALDEICNHYLDNHHERPSRRNRPHVAASINVDGLIAGEHGWTTDTGVLLNHSIIEYLSCDANLHTVLKNRHGAVLDYGRATRTISPDLFAALAERDGGCRAPGCDAPAENCEAHHIVHWSKGGDTSLANLVLACRGSGGHHHHWHKNGWGLELDAHTAILKLTPPGGKPPRYTRPRHQPGTSLTGI